MILVMWNHHCIDIAVSPVGSQLSLIQIYHSFLSLSFNTSAFVSSKRLYSLTPCVPDRRWCNCAFSLPTPSHLPCLFPFLRFSLCRHQFSSVLAIITRILGPTSTSFFTMKRTGLPHIKQFSLKIDSESPSFKKPSLG